MKLYSKKIVALGVLAALVVGACGDDEPSKAPSAITANCGNGTVDTGEECDTTIGSANCSTATLGAQPTGTLSCSTTTCQFVTTGCTGGSGAGGSGTGGSGS